MATLMPDKQYSEPDITVADLITLGREMAEKGVSKSTREFIGMLATRPPDVRLAANLQSLLRCMLEHGRCENVLQDGLRPFARDALIELDVCGLSVRSREIAHGLLNVHERWLAMRKLGPLFKAAKTHKDEYINLDQFVLGAEDFEERGKDDAVESC